ncbi:hypothetical protein [Actinomadura macra]|uniref:hypothetical protein n=1 Tax=Actinomadura macra TaxID=46164 RepID=UPI00083385F9|nr:hypothetical protein [Actinomadura macra]
MTDQQRPAWAVRLQAERQARGWGPFETARRLREAVGITHHPTDKVKSLAKQVTRHEKGHVFPTDWATAYTTAYETTSADLFGTENPSLYPDASVDIPAPLHAREDDMERRALLQLAALGMSVGTLGSSGEPVRQLLALTLDSESRDLDDWRMTMSDHMHAIRTRPPAQVRDGLIVDLVAVQRQLRTADADDKTELQRVTAGLSILYANVLTRLGDHSGAIHWWRTARAAADASGDLDLRLVVLASEAGFGLYGQRSPTTVLTLTRKAMDISGNASSIGRAKAGTAEVKALSLLGRHMEARQALRVLNQSDPGQVCADLIPAYWTGNELHFAESWVYAHAGDEAAADVARERVLSYSPRLDYQYDANVRLHEALCTVVNGGTDTGAKQAAEILAALPPTQQSHMITETGKVVLHAIPRERWDHPAVRDLHALVSGPNRHALA